MNELEKNNINLFGERGKQWIQSLPEITESLSKKWQLTDIVPVENISWNYVAKAHSQKHGPGCPENKADNICAKCGFNLVSLLTSSEEILKTRALLSKR